MDKPYLWLVNGCLEYHWPKLVQLTIPDITKLVPILPRVLKEGNLNILFQGLVQEVKHEQRLQYSSNSAETTEKTSWLPVSSPSPTLGSLSSDIFEWRASTGTVPFSLLLWDYHICIAKCLYSYTDDLPENLTKTTAKEFKKSTSGLRASLKNVVA